MTIVRYGSPSIIWINIFIFIFIIYNLYKISILLSIYLSSLFVGLAKKHPFIYIYLLDSCCHCLLLSWRCSSSIFMPDFTDINRLLAVISFICYLIRSTIGNPSSIFSIIKFSKDKKIVKFTKSTVKNQ